MQLVNNVNIFILRAYAYAFVHGSLCEFFASTSRLNKILLLLIYVHLRKPFLGLDILN